MSNFMKVATAAVALATCAGTAGATTYYFDLSSFQAATGATLAEDFNDTPSTQFIENQSYAFDHMSISYADTDGEQFAGVATAAQIDAANGASINSSNALAWGEYAIFGDGKVFETANGPIVTISLNKATTAFGFFFSDSDNSDSYQVNFGSQSAVISATTATFTGFFGYVFDTPVTSFSLSQFATGGLTETFSIDDIYLPAVPVPASLPLLGGALALLGLRRKRRG